MEPFPSLESLTLNRCPPSTVLDLYLFRNRLKKLEIINSGIPELSKILAPIKQRYLQFPPLCLLGNHKEPSPSYVWSKLVVLNLCNCGLTRLDSSLHLLPNLLQLDVSHNDIKHIIHLYHSVSLSTLNFSHNRVSVLSNLGLVIPNIKRLNLSHNMIESLDGIDKLYLLERIDLSYNRLNDFGEFSCLVKLAKLTHIYVSGNPIASRSNYRLHVLTQFLHESSLNGRNLPILDDICLSPEEISTLRSSIFLPPEIAFGDNSKSSIQSSVLLIGGSLMKPDDVPIHELDKLFSAESSKYRTESPIYGLVNGTSTKTSFSFSREKLQAYCQQRFLKRNRKYHIRQIHDGDDEPHVPVDVSRLIRASSTGSTRHSNETLVFSDGGLHLLEFEDLEDDQNSLPIVPKSPMLNRSLANAETSLRSDSVNSSVDQQNTGSRSSSNGTTSVRIKEGESKSTDSADVSRRSNDSVPASFSTFISEEIPDLSALMLQMAKVSSETIPNQPIESDNKPIQNTSYNSTSSMDLSYLNILMEVVNEDSSMNSPSSIEEKSEDSPQRSNASIPDSHEVAEHSNVNRRVRKSRWGTTKPSLGNDFRSFGSSKLYQTSGQSHRSNSPPGSIISDSWESKHSKPNIETQTEASSVYSGEDPRYFPQNAPTTIQIAHMFNRASQEEAHRFAAVANQHFLNSPVQSYTGSLDYEYLSVVDNLEKYFSEQVFGSSRPSREAPYMRREYTQEQNDRYCRDFSQLHDMNPLEILYVDIPYRPERFIAVYRVKVLDITHLEDKVNAEDQVIIPEPLIFAVTDINLYVIVDNILNNSIFADAPLPVLRRVHPIDSLRCCLVYFGFQRCAFQFCDNDIDSSLRKKYQSYGQGTTTYMIVTNDKALTYPLITTFPATANILRQARNLSKVNRDNRDSQLLDRVAEIIRQLSCDETDIVYYQMLYQVWRQKPGVLVPRTFIVTPRILLLCHEEITCLDVQLQLLDHIFLTNIYRVKQEDDPLKITIIMKPESAMSFTKRKWRLMADNVNIIMKIRDEIRKTCQDANIHHD